MTSGWVRCGWRGAAWIAAAFSGMARRRARLSAVVIRVVVHRAAEPGSGALCSSASGSRAARSSNAASAAGE